MTTWDYYSAGSDVSVQVSMMREVRMHLLRRQSWTTILASGPLLPWTKRKRARVRRKHNATRRRLKRRKSRAFVAKVRIQYGVSR
jgi:hypothetical protein